MTFAFGIVLFLNCFKVRMGGHLRLSASTYRGQKCASDPLELETQAVVNWPTQCSKLYTDSLKKNNTECILSSPYEDVVPLFCIKSSLLWFAFLFFCIYSPVTLKILLLCCSQVWLFFFYLLTVFNVFFYTEGRVYFGWGFQRERVFSGYGGKAASI